MPKVLAFAGSARSGSFNKLLIRIAAAGAREAGAAVTEIDLRDFPMPIYDGDVEKAEGLPEHAKRIRTLMAEHDGLLLSCPEYNSGITPLLKNVIDWASRSDAGEPSRAYRDKTAALVSASPGRLGGLRGLVQVRAILTTLGVLVLPDQQAIPGARQAFDDDGQLVDEALDARVRSVGAKLQQTLEKLHR